MTSTKVNFWINTNFFSKHSSPTAYTPNNYPWFLLLSLLISLPRWTQVWHPLLLLSNNTLMFERAWNHDAMSMECDEIVTLNDVVIWRLFGGWNLQCCLQDGEENVVEVSIVSIKYNNDFELGKALRWVLYRNKGPQDRSWGSPTFL